MKVNRRKMMGLSAGAVGLGITNPLSVSAQLWKAVENSFKKASVTPQEQTLLRLREDPTYVMTACGYTPDPWQVEALNSNASHLLLLWSRQIGKSLTSACIAVRQALLFKSDILLISRAERQSIELFRKVMDVYHALGAPVPKSNDQTSELHLTNGSRIVPLPGKEDTIRSFSAIKLLIIDEASRVPTEVYNAVSPMLMRSRGRMICISTPYGKRGFFYEAWEGLTKDTDWSKSGPIMAEDCPSVDKKWLQEEHNRVGDRAFRQEYQCSFEDMIGAVFSSEVLDKAFQDVECRPLWESVNSLAAKDNVHAVEGRPLFST